MKRFLPVVILTGLLLSLRSQPPPVTGPKLSQLSVSGISSPQVLVVTQDASGNSTISPAAVTGASISISGPGVPTRLILQPVLSMSVLTASANTPTQFLVGSTPFMVIRNRLILAPSEWSMGPPVPPATGALLTVPQAESGDTVMAVFSGSQ